MFVNRIIIFLFLTVGDTLYTALVGRCGGLLLTTVSFPKYLDHADNICLTSYLIFFVLLCGIYDMQTDLQWHSKAPSVRQYRSIDVEKHVMASVNSALTTSLAYGPDTYILLERRRWRQWIGHILRRVTTLLLVMPYTRIHYPKMVVV